MPVVAREKIRKSETWLVVSLVLLVLLVVAFSFAKLKFVNFYDSMEGEISDNRAWVVFRLEVDYHRLRRAVADAQLGLELSQSEEIPDDDWANLLLAFDLYYSRITVVEAQKHALAELSDFHKRFRINHDFIQAHRDTMADMVDSATTPDRDLIRNLNVELDLLAEPIRTLALDTLAVLSNKADFERRSMRAYAWLGTLASILVIALLTTVAVTIYLMLRHSRKQYTELVRLTEIRRRLLRQISSAFIFTDCDGRIASSNLGVEKLFGWEEQDIVGKNIVELLLPEKRRRNANYDTLERHRKILSTGESVTVREIAVHRNGRRFPVEIIVMYLEVDEERTYLIKFRGLAVEQRAMRVLRRDRINAEKRAFQNSKLLSVMSHEIRTPLHSVIAALDLVTVQKTKQKARTEQLIHVAQEAAQTALLYADGALDLVKLESNPEIARIGDFSPSNLVLDMVEIMRPAAARNNNVIILDFEAGTDQVVTGRPDLLRHALSNLLSNAIKFTSNGRINVDLRRDSEGFFKIAVVDTGCGISKDDMERIVSDSENIGWSRPFQSDWKGQGIGLGLFKRAVSVMGGSWGLETELGKGSRFWFRFPGIACKNNKATELSAPPPTLVSDLSSIRILAVDDNPINLKLLGAMLGSLEIKHELAANGEVAIDKARRVRFDLVLLDIGMPGLDGYETMQQIRKTGESKDAIFVGFTADTTIRKEKGKAHRAGLNDVLYKPVKICELRHKILQHCSVDEIEFEPPKPNFRAKTDDVLDEDVVRHLLELAGVDELSHLVETLIRQGTDIDDFLRSGEAYNPRTLEARFHALTGAAGMMGASLLSGISKECENALIAENALSIKYVEAFKRSVEATKSAFSNCKVST